MSDDAPALTGPDLSSGIPLESIPDGGLFAGHADGQSVILSRNGDEVFAIGGVCTHYGAPLGHGLVVGNTIRCPWHHACFDLRTGVAIRAPALKPVAVWETIRDGALVKVVRETPASDGATPVASGRPSGEDPRSIVIVGTGAAGNAAAEMLRRLGYGGKLTMIGADDAAPYDRPNLSKDYLAGDAPEEWIPLRPAEFYAEHDIELRKGVTVTSLDVRERRVELSAGESVHFDKLLLATGAEPVRLPIPGADLGHVHYLRSLADSRRIIEAAKTSEKAVVIGASFIGLEVAASLRKRGLEVDVVAPESVPLERVLGPELGEFIRSKHEEKGVRFHLGRTSREIDAGSVTLDDDTRLPADLVVVGVGVRPRVSLAEQAGAAIDKGVVVDEFLETSIPGVYAAGDIARYPDHRSGEPVRIEHWVVAERQGQTAAHNLLGMKEKFVSVPFFWSNHYDTAITYVGHAERWDEVVIAGSLEEGSCLVGYRSGGKILAVAATGREKASLEAEAAMERSDWVGLEKLLDREATR
ncbi:MAG: FAD-dependent oxidoreductase [Gemmatimonadaceae bacterium]